MILHLTWFIFILAIGSFAFEPGLYGNAGEDYIDGNNALALYDPKTGNVTTIAKSPTDRNNITESDLAVFDAQNEMYWYYTQILNYSNSISLLCC